jgi:type VI secretion system protein ImpF
MANVTPPKERLQPSLLDRLVARRPEHAGTPLMITVEVLRDSVRRELAALLSAASLEAVAQDAKELERYPQVRRSSPNFGMSALAGRTASSVNLAQLERQLTRAIREFEPRVSGSTLRVRAVGDEGGKNHNRLAFEIEGELWAQPLPQRLLLRTELDLESGQVSVEESRG